MLSTAARRLRGNLPNPRTLTQLDLRLGRYQMRALEHLMSTAARLRPGRVRVGDLDLAIYERHNPGTPVVFLHGFGGDKETWLLMAPFFRQRPIILVDLPGHGASTPIGGDRANAAAMGRAVIGLLDARGIERVDLCGNSMGGGIALWIAHHHPDRVRSLALVSSASPDMAESELTRAIARGDNFLIPGEDEGERFVKLMVEKPPRVPPAVKRYVAARRAAARPRLEAMFRGWLDSTGDDDMPTELEAIRQPALILHGDRDRVVDVATARILQRRLPNAELCILPGIGHVPQLEAPTRVAQAIGRHLAKLPS